MILDCCVSERFLLCCHGECFLLGGMCEGGWGGWSRSMRANSLNDGGGETHRKEGKISDLMMCLCPRVDVFDCSSYDNWTCLPEKGRKKQTTKVVCYQRFPFTA